MGLNAPHRACDGGIQCDTGSSPSILLSPGTFSVQGPDFPSSSDEALSLPELLAPAEGFSGSSLLHYCVNTSKPMVTLTWTVTQEP
jgi:hypothetical protein